MTGHSGDADAAGAAVSAITPRVRNHFITVRERYVRYSHPEKRCELQPAMTCADIQRHQIPISAEEVAQDLFHVRVVGLGE